MVCIQRDLVTFDIDHTQGHRFPGWQFHFEREPDGWRCMSWKRAPGHNFDKIIVIWSVCLVGRNIDLPVLAGGHSADRVIETWNDLTAADAEAERLPTLR